MYKNRRLLGFLPETNNFSYTVATPNNKCVTVAIVHSPCSKDTTLNLLNANFFKAILFVNQKEMQDIYVAAWVWQNVIYELIFL